MKIVVKRVYEAAAKDDGFRILVDRLWPRGVSKEKAHVDLWLKNIAPSTELREWFNHEADKWPEFKRRYREELRNTPDAVREFHDATRGQETVTLVYGAKDEQHNQAVALQEILSRRPSDD